MKVKRIVSLITAVLLVAVMFLGISRTAETVYADAGDAAMQMGASALSKGANTAGAQVLKYGGQSWYVIAHDGGSATLLAKENLGRTPYDPNTISNAYGTSTLKTKIDAIAGDLQGELRRR